MNVLQLPAWLLVIIAGVLAFVALVESRGRDWAAWAALMLALAVGALLTAGFRFPL